MSKPVIIPNAQPNLVAVWVQGTSIPDDISDFAMSPIVAWAITPEENEDPDTIDPELCGRPLCVAGHEATLILDTATGRVWEIGSLLGYEDLKSYFECRKARIDGENRRAAYRAAQKAATP